MKKFPCVIFIRPNGKQRDGEVPLTNAAYDKMTKLAADNFRITCEDCGMFVNVCIEDTLLQEDAMSIILNHSMKMDEQIELLSERIKAFDATTSFHAREAEKKNAT